MIVKWTKLDVNENGNKSLTVLSTESYINMNTICGEKNKI